ncbi:MAG: NifB/NifX family molybdenum-iron cluster-binding protein [Candidatus Pacebacteria bacterium]|nr:NifB/NifX family molybdenum-iron cluster-binding protein [Candidatus Paceibacterota bacterium]
MKIALSSLGKDINSDLSKVFGRCPCFFIMEIEDKKVKGFEAIENTSQNQMGGAGISAVRTIAGKNVDAVIAGAFGPRALTVLKQFNIEAYTGAGSINEVSQKFIQGKLKKIQ